MEKPFPAYQGDDPHVFVCYAHADADVVYREIVWLRDQGFHIWYDEGISPGTTWRNELADSISNAKLFLFFVTPQSVDSINCQREVNFAVDHNVPVIAVHLEETDLTSGMDLTLSTIQAILKYEQSDQDYRTKLLSGASERIKRGIAATSSVAPIVRSSRTLIAAVAVLALVSGVTLGWLVFVAPASTNSGTGAEVVRAELNLDASQELSVFGMNPFTISGDGSRVAFAAAPSDAVNQGETLLYARELGTGVVSSFPGTEGAGQPFFSPGGAWIGFSAAGELKKVAAMGGAPITISKLPRGGSLQGATWTQDDRIVFNTTTHSGLKWVAASGGETMTLTEPDPNEARHALPHALPNGDILFTMFSESHSQTAYVSMQTSKVRTIDVPGNQSRSIYVPGGYLVWSTLDGSGTGSTRLMAAAFDLDTLEVGAAASLVEGVQSSGVGSAPGYYAVSKTGSLVYMSYLGPQLLARIVRVSRQGESEPLSEQRIFHYPRLAPNEQWIAVAIHGSSATDHDIFLYEVGRGTGTRFTSGVNGHLPLWTPAGDKITFARQSAGDSNDFDIYWKGLDEEGNGEPLLEAEGNQIPRSWSPDGRHLLYETDNVDSGKDLWVLTPGGTSEPFLTSTDSEHSGVFSPNGKFVAYVSDATEGNQVYVRPFPGPGRARRISVEGGIEPLWSADGLEVIYRHAKYVISVSIGTSDDGNIGELGQPEVVFQGSYTSYGLGGPNYDVSADGNRFLMLETADRGNTDTQLKLILNWTEELKRLVPKE